jgi:hypothetical protein
LATEEVWHGVTHTARARLRASATAARDRSSKPPSWASFPSNRNEKSNRANARAPGLESLEIAHVSDGAIGTTAKGRGKINARVRGHRRARERRRERTVREAGARDAVKVVCALTTTSSQPSQRPPPCYTPFRL